MKSKMSNNVLTVLLDSLLEKLARIINTHYRLHNLNLLFFRSSISPRLPNKTDVLLEEYNG